MQNTHLIKAIGFALILWLLAIADFYIGAEGSIIKRLGVLFGGDVLNGGYIQFITYIAFFWCLLDIFSQAKSLQTERNAIDSSQLLPDRETDKFRVLTPEDVNGIRMKVIQGETRSKSLYSDLIKKATTKFRTNRSISEMLEVVSAQVGIYKTRSEGSQSVIRYLAWAIPSIGFIGTVMGISQALGIADSGDTALITGTLGLAFDTTLVALILMIIVMWFFHRLQQKTDEYHAHLEDYVIDNLINRIES